MGASEFLTKASGRTPAEAFDSACYEARFEHGHGGYTGTIAEKRKFVMISVPLDKEPYKYAQNLLTHGDIRIDDKWGPCGCIELGAESPGVYQYLFFGWASS